MKLNIYDLSIEVTRRCNMACAHCLRGDAQQKDLDLDKLEIFLKDVEYIGSITFTGGEPTLNVPAIRETLNLCKKYGICVSSFYVVTNGKQITTDFLVALLEWYAYCVESGGEIETCGVTISNDEFHDNIDKHGQKMLEGLSFYCPCDKTRRWLTQGGLLNLGRARTLSSAYDRREAIDHDIQVEMHRDVICVEDDVISFTVDGKILNCCDYEYGTEEQIKICDFDNAVEIFTKIAKNEEEESA